VSAPACPECPHCQAAAATAERERVMVSSIRSQLRPWEYAGYGQKITAIVDWYDGWWVGTNAETEDVEVPAQIIDKRQWVSGFLDGWKDAAEARVWRREREPVPA
jgi:hypothetical protein